MSNKDDQAPTTFPKKWYKLIERLPEFKDIADAASVEDLKKIIISSEGHISTVEKAKEADVKLNGAKEFLKENSEPYKESIRFATAKIKYALFLLEGKGIDIEHIKD